MANILSELMTKAVSYIFTVDGYCGILLLAALIIYPLKFLCFHILGKEKSRKRDVHLILLTFYDALALIPAATLRWWVAIIVAVLAYALFRRKEKSIWKHEIEKKRVEGDINELLISPKGIWLNMGLTYLLAQFILYILRF